MNDTQELKTKATLLQSHLQAVGLALPRNQALTIVAKLEGYRSFTVAKHGKPHGGPKAPVLHNGRQMTPEVVDSYVANGGRHCPYCGSTRLQDDNQALSDVTLWDFRVRCLGCSRAWFGTYTADHRKVFGQRKDSDEGFRAGGTECCGCGSDEHLEYASPVLTGPEVLQPVHCTSCRTHWFDVYALSNLAELNAT